MKKILLTPIKNEEALLRTFIDHHKRYFDVIIIADQGSSDNSWNIITSYPEVVPVRNESRHYDEGKRKNLLYEQALKYGADNLLFLLDADEFLMATNEQWEDFCQHCSLTESSNQSYSFDWIFLNPDKVSAVTFKNTIFAHKGNPRKYELSHKIHLSRFRCNDRPICTGAISVLHINLLWQKRQLVKSYYYMALEILQKGGLCMRQRRTLYNYAYGYLGNPERLDESIIVQANGILESILVSDSYETWHYKELCLILSDPSKGYKLRTLPIWGFPWKTEACLAQYRHIPELSLSGFLIQLWLKATRRYPKSLIVRVVENLIDQLPPFREGK
jgi:glycosyltransferase involved in cell wall biosynthesis